jgi:cytochrome c553
MLSVSYSFVLLATLGPAADKPTFNRDIRPILAENCFACHGPDKAARKADLRLDVREEAIKAGAIVPGKPTQSTMIERLDAKGVKLMPPPKSHKKLTPAQKATLTAWVAAGAEYEAHWSFIPPKRPSLPTVKNPAWVRNPIDHFVLAKLEANGLKPAPEASKEALARRAALDLTGLPPEPALVARYLADTRPDAYERYIDSLLASPFWGEHRGRYWLDAARYADTHGIHFDNYREIWAYRDWVIRAFNANQSFDQFTIDQIAGDLVPNPTLDQLIATGFNRCNITTNEGGVIAEEYLVLYTRDRTETVSQVWMGLTAGCAVCHDHKFDPLSQKEFYQLAAFFNNTTQGAMDGNIKNTPPVIPVPRSEDQPRLQVLQRELEAVRKLAADRKNAARPAFEKWLASVKPADVGGAPPTDGLVFHAPLTEGKGKVELFFNQTKRAVDLKGTWIADRGGAGKALQLANNSQLALKDVGDFDHPNGFSFGTWIRPTAPNLGGAVFARMDEGNDFRGWDLWLEGGRIGAHIINKWQTDAVKVVANPPLKVNAWQHVFVTYDGSGKAAGLKIYIDGVEVKDRQIQADNLKSTTRTTVPFKLGQRNTTSRVTQFALQDVRLYSRNLPALEVNQIAGGGRIGTLVAKPADKRSPAEKEELLAYYLSKFDADYKKTNERLTQLSQEESRLINRGTIAHVMNERAGMMPEAFILFRGEYDKRRDKVSPAVPAVLPKFDPKLPNNRLGLAQWLMRDDHPLTARATVNRFWQEVFGTGLVRTAEDLGISGDLPSHPELLDWMAVEFRESGWDVKRFYRLLLTSATYRQAALTTPEKREKDPANRLLSRGPRFRMDAEMIRDHALAASGILVANLGGESVKPYQPDGVWEAVAMIGSNTRDYRRDSGEKLYRRSMYTFWKRSAPPANLEIFNAPNRELCTVRRERTNTPLQALVTLNDPQFVEAARYLAERVLKEGGSDDSARLEFLARRVLARTFTAEEQPIVRGLLNDLVAEFKADNTGRAAKLLRVGEWKSDPSLDGATLAGWTMLINAVMNMDEVLNK